MLKVITDPISRMKDFWLSAHTFDILNEQLRKEVIDVFDTVRCVKYQQKI